MSQHIFNLHHACDWGKLLAIPVEHIFHREEARGEDEEADPFSSPLPESPPWKALLPNLPPAHLESHLPYHHFHPWTKALKCDNTNHLFFFIEWTNTRTIPLPPLLGSWRLATLLPPSIRCNPSWTARPSWSGWVCTKEIVFSSSINLSVIHTTVRVYAIFSMSGSFVRVRSTWVWSWSIWRTQRSWETDFHPRSLMIVISNRYFDFVGVCRFEEHLKRC